MVKYFKGPLNKLSSTVVQDGRLIFTVDQGHIYLDNGSERIELYKKDLDRLQKMGLPVGGARGQIIQKTGEGNYKVGWTSALSDIEIDAIMGLCENIADDTGNLGAYVKVDSMKLSQLLANGGDIVHPAFTINGVNKPSLYIGKYEGIQTENRIYSLPGVSPKVDINLDTYEEYCLAKGPRHHCITAAEWAFLALRCKKNGTQPKGNNDYGKDIEETEYSAIPSPDMQDGGKTAYVLTGTGPLSWRHNGKIDGICDLNGNICEWTPGIRLVYGELQVLPDNDAAGLKGNSANYGQWKAISVNATSWNDLYIEPDGYGTTTASVKLDYVSNHWQWQYEEPKYKSEEPRYAAFGATTCGSMNAGAKLYLQAMALLPEDGATAEDYNNDYVSAVNYAPERYAYRGGLWNSGSEAGMFYLNLSYSKSYHSNGVGGRPAYYK